MSERVTVCHVYLGLCPVSRQIWISSQTSHICYSLLQYVTQRHGHVTRITSHFTLFVRRITIVYLLIWATTWKLAFIFMPQYLLALISVHSWTPGYFSSVLLLLRKIWISIELEAECDLCGPVHCLSWGLQFSIKWATEQYFTGSGLHKSLCSPPQGSQGLLYFNLFTHWTLGQRPHVH